MSVYRILVLFIVAVAFAFGNAPSAFAESCDNLPSEVSTSAESLYGHALLLGEVFDKIPANDSCAVNNGMTRSTPSISELDTTNYLKDYYSSQAKWSDYISEMWNTVADGTPPDSTSIFESPDGTVYVTCNRDTPEFRLAISWDARLQRNDNVPQALYVSFRTAIILADRVLPDVEKLGLETFELESNSNGGISQFTAIPGTDFFEFPTVRASINALIQESCVFQVAVIVVNSLVQSAYSEDRRYQALRNLIVMGHSLGGTAAHYVASRYDGAFIKSTHQQFKAYSFNALGLEPGYMNVQIPIKSYYVEGEIVSLMGTAFNWQQRGRVFRGVPEQSSLDPLPNNSWKLIWWDWGERMDRHSLVFVQETLCQCVRRGTGALESGMQPQ